MFDAATATIERDLGEVTAFVLAGGLGTRLSSTVADRSKVVAMVRGRPFLAFVLDQLAGAGLRDVVLCTGHRAESVESALGERWEGMRLRYSREAEPLGTAGALRHALPLSGASTALALNGDSWCQADLGAFWRFHSDRRARATLLLARVEDTRRYGRVTTGRNGRVLAFEEKGEQAGPGWINAGVYLLHRDAIEAIATPGPVSLERDVLPNLIGGELYAFPGGREFLDIGTPESYAAAEQFFRGGTAP